MTDTKKISYTDKQTELLTIANKQVFELLTEIVDDNRDGIKDYLVSRIISTLSVLCAAPIKQITNWGDPTEENLDFLISALGESVKNTVLSFNADGEEK